MSKEVLKYLLDIPQVVEKIKKCGLIIMMWIKNMLNMARRNDISVNAINKIPIREYVRKKRYQNSKYTILKNGAYYFHYNWYKNHEVR